MTDKDRQEVHLIVQEAINASDEKRSGKHSAESAGAQRDASTTKGDDAFATLEKAFLAVLTNKKTWSNEDVRSAIASSVLESHLTWKDVQNLSKGQRRCSGSSTAATQQFDFNVVMENWRNYATSVALFWGLPCQPQTLPQ